MRLSIVVPALNEADVIGALLHDLQSPRRAGHEVIVVDGGSSDATLAIATPQVDLALASTPGRAAQMNAGARRARGDALWFVHADSRVPDAAATALLDALDDGADWGRFDVALSGRDPRLRVVETAMNWRSWLTAIATGDQGIFVRRTLFDALGGFPAIPLMEDVALCKRLRRHGRPACIRRPRLQASSRRWESRGLLRTIVLMWRLRLAYALGTPPEQLARRYQ